MHIIKPLLQAPKSGALQRHGAKLLTLTNSSALQAMLLYALCSFTFFFLCVFLRRPPVQNKVQSLVRAARYSVLLTGKTSLSLRDSSKSTSAFIFQTTKIATVRSNRKRSDVSFSIPSDALPFGSALLLSRYTSFVYREN